VCFVQNSSGIRFLPQFLPRPPISAVQHDWLNLNCTASADVCGMQGTGLIGFSADRLEVCPINRSVVALFAKGFFRSDRDSGRC